MFDVIETLAIACSCSWLMIMVLAFLAWTRYLRHRENIVLADLSGAQHKVKGVPNE